jgi:hypothetical protein
VKASKNPLPAVDFPALNSKTKKDAGIQEKTIHPIRRI